MNTVLRSKKIITLFFDILFIYPSLYLSLAVRHFQFPPMLRYLQGVIPFSIVGVVFILNFYISGLYTLQDLRNFASRLKKTVQAFGIATVFAMAVFYLMPPGSYSPKSILVLFSIFYFLFINILRHISFKILATAYPVNNVALIGWDPILNDFLDNSDLAAVYNLKCNFIFLDSDFSTTLIGGSQSPEISQDIADLESRIIEGGFDVIVLKKGLGQEEEIREVLFRNLSRDIVYMSVPEFYEVIMGKIPVNSINQMWFLEHLEFRNKIWYEKLKRTFDFAFGMAGFLLTLPLWPFISILIKLSGKGPVLFTQTRSGIGTRPFTIYKFRTMTVENNSHAMTVQGDARITKIGSFLRKSRLDEIPQFLNIIKGDMSFVGPRPERPELISELIKKVPFYTQRMLVSPGLTGWDQVSGEYHSASVDDTLKKMQYDLYYIKNRSLYLDLIILLKTIATVLSRGGR